MGHSNRSWNEIGHYISLNNQSAAWEFEIAEIFSLCWKTMVTRVEHVAYKQTYTIRFASINETEETNWQIMLSLNYIDYLNFRKKKQILRNKFERLRIDNHVCEKRIWVKYNDE